MAKKSSLLNMALTLTLVCLGASAAVAVVYAVTKGPIEIANQEKINSAIKEVVPEFDNTPSEEIVNVVAESGETGEAYIAKKGDQITGYAIKSTTSKGFGGPFTIMVGFTPDGVVYNTSVISHSETPGLGAKITESASNFIQQWKGKNLTDGSVNVAVKKDGGDIDAITASTITSRAYCDAMEIAAALFKSVANGDSNGGSKDDCCSSGGNCCKEMPEGENGCGESKCE